MKEENRNKIESVDLEGNKKVVFVTSPTSRDIKDAQLAYNRAFRDALESGAILRQKLDVVMQEQGIWTDEKQEKYVELLKSMAANEKRLGDGGIKLSEAKEIAHEMRSQRLEFSELISERTTMDANTAEGQADNYRFNFLLHRVIKDEENQQVFDSVQEYDDAGNEPYVVACAAKFAETMYGLDKDYDKNLPENEFLLDYGFVDEKLRYVNEDGDLVDFEGNKVDDLGRRVDHEGNTVYIEGNQIDERGRYVNPNKKPFLDDKGKPVTKEEEAKEEEAEKKPATKARSKRATTKTE